MPIVVPTPQYDQTELEEIVPKLIQSITLPEEQICLNCLGATLQAMLQRPVCFRSGAICDYGDLWEIVEDGFFDDVDRVEDDVHNAEGYVRYLLDAVNSGVDEMHLYADRCHDECTACQMSEVEGVIGQIIAKTLGAEGTGEGVPS